jgi:hypothetical protein
MIWHVDRPHLTRPYACWCPPFPVIPRTIGRALGTHWARTGHVLGTKRTPYQHDPTDPRPGQSGIIGEVIIG